jgi:hypothetical protein
MVRFKIASQFTPDEMLSQRTGEQVRVEIGGRLLVRYLQTHQTESFINGSDRRHWVTPTPYSPEDTVPYLALPKPVTNRDYAMLLDPVKIDSILGPRWITLGKGIEYLLPNGFPKEAIVEGLVFKVT